MRRALLDINVLLALLDADHVHHRSAREWLEREIEWGWASCPLTENGFVRVLSQPHYPSPVSVSVAVDRLEQATTTQHHVFWPDAVSLLDPDVVDPTLVHGPRQVTDAYLIALAVANDGRLATFDRSVALTAVRGADESHVVVI